MISSPLSLYLGFLAIYPHLIEFGKRRGRFFTEMQIPQSAVNVYRAQMLQFIPYGKNGQDQIPHMK